MHQSGSRPERSVPLSLRALEGSSLPVLLSDEHGRVVVYNGPAEALFGTPAEEAVGRFCWEVTGLEDDGGRPFCLPDCRLRKLARRGGAADRSTAHLPAPGGARQRLDVLTFYAPAGQSGGRAVLHVFLPSGPLLAIEESVARLERLSTREREVLAQLASGADTAEIARRLFISPATVRNHVQHVLEKLGVHHRLEAILAALHRLEW